MGENLGSNPTFADSFLGCPAVLGLDAEYSFRYDSVIMDLKLSSDGGVSATTEFKIQVFTKATPRQLVNSLKYFFLDWMSILYLCASHSRSSTTMNLL